jgi:hypothetical protein
MNPRSTWIWAAVAAALFGFIYAVQVLTPPDTAGAKRILPMIQSSRVSTVQVRPKGELEIRAERTNGQWILTEPLAYPAQGDSINQLLGTLERLVPATRISSRELRDRPQAQQEYGFTDPQASIVITQPGSRAHLLVGSRTAPGDQVFLQVVGVEGVYVVDATLLKYVPLQADLWRDTAFTDLQNLDFDRVTVTNAGRFFELQRATPESPWRIAKPIPARADANRVEQALESLRNLRVLRFVPEKGDADLEAMRLLPPELAVGLWRGTNPACVLQFGNNPTNHAQEVYALASVRGTLATVSEALVAPWRASASEFRDRHVVKITEPISRLDVKADDTFSVVRTNGGWWVAPQGFPADARLMTNAFHGLEKIEVGQFVKDVVTEPDLAGYGLAPALRQYSLYTSSTNSSGVTTQAVFVEIQFGTNADNRVMVRRTDENSVYAVACETTNLVPARSWQMRERQILDFLMEDVARVSLQQSGRKREIVRNGAHDWSLAPGTPGMINDLAIEETVKGLARLTAAAWVARNPPNLPAYGLTPDSLEVTVELKNQQRLAIRLGGDPSSQSHYGATSLDGEIWVFDFPWALYRDVTSHLSVPANGS